MTADLINTVEAPGEFDALTKLRPDEPYFPLVGRDKLAPRLVQEWADENRKRALADHDAGKISDEERDRELRKSTQAEAIGWAMTAYKAGHKAKAMAEQAEARPTYTGHELPEETLKADRIQSARARAASALNNATAELAALAELVGDGMEGLDLDISIQELRQLSDIVEPPRVGLKPCRG